MSKGWLVVLRKERGVKLFDRGSSLNSHADRICELPVFPEHRTEFIDVFRIERVYEPVHESVNGSRLTSISGR